MAKKPLLKMDKIGHNSVRVFVSTYFDNKLVINFAFLNFLYEVFRIKVLNLISTIFYY